jgi:aminoglycoside phosphotransferase (APT) family kinase protein
MPVETADQDRGRNALGIWMADRLGRLHGRSIRSMHIGPLRFPASGQSNETSVFRADWNDGLGDHHAEFVLRRQPSTSQMFHDADVVREYEVLEQLASLRRVPVPPLLGVEPSADVLGVPFFVMSRVEGTVPYGKPSIHVAGWLPTLTPQQRHQVWRSGLEVLCALHSCDWEPLCPRLGSGNGIQPGVRDHLDWLERYHQWSAQDRDFPITEEALRYLRSRVGQIGDRSTVLCWGDARIGNMIFASDLSVAAAVDWELATIGPAEIDLGHWLLFDEFYTDACQITRLEGFPDRESTIVDYEAISGREVGDLEYFELMAGVMLATTLIRQADIQVDHGRLPPTTRMGRDNTVTQMLARRLNLPVPDLDADFLARRSMANPTPTPLGY